MVAGDISQRATLLPEYFRCIYNCMCMCVSQ